MKHVGYIFLLGLMSFTQDPPRLIAYKQAVSKGMKRMEVTMDGETKRDKSSPSNTYLFWLVSKNIEDIKIISIIINGRAVHFDTTHVHGPIRIEDGIRSPMQSTSGRIVQDSTTSSIKLNIKDSIISAETSEEYAIVKYRTKGKCAKKLKKTIEFLPARVTQ